jgi:hypothetical protein
MLKINSKTVIKIKFELKNPQNNKNPTKIIIKIQ